VSDETPTFLQEGAGEHTDLARDLSLFDITMIGVGAMIGAGIFVLSGLAAGQSGPAIVMAFAFNGFITIFTGMVYAELGSAIPEAGGGYLWVRDALGRSQAFLAGWMSWFAHAVAGSLYALGFGSFMTLLLVEYFHVTPFGIAPPILEKVFAGVAGVAFAYINFRGAKETGLAGNIVTLLKVTVILIFIAFGVTAMAGHPATTLSRFEPFTPRGYGGVFISMGLTFIAFEGYEIIVQSGEEVVDPKRNIPKAVFYSMAIVVPIYMLVGAVLVGAVGPTPQLLEAARQGLSETGGSATIPANAPVWQLLGHIGPLGLARAAAQVLPYGTLAILVAGIFSTLSALNATTFSSTRVGFAMGRDKVLPDAFSRVHTERRTPHISVLFSGALIVFMAVALPIEDVAAATDVMFLLLFLQVNYAAIVIRRKYGDRLRYGYLMPWFPVVPIVGIVTKLALAVYLFNYSPTAWYGALAWIGVGLGIFFLYSRRKIRASQIRAETRLVTEERAPVERGYQVLVPIADPAHAGALVRLAAQIARARQGELLLTSVVTVPGTTPLDVGRKYVGGQREVLEAAMKHVPEDVPAHFTVTIGHDVGKSLVNIAHERDSDLIVMGWRGRRRRVADIVLGEVLDRVVEDAPCDVCVAKVEESGPSRRVLAPLGGGAQAELAAVVAGTYLADPEAEVTFLAVTHGDAEAARDRLEGRREEVLEELGAEDAGDRIRVDAVRNGDIADAILDYARRGDFDTIALGATEQGLVRRALFGAIPETVGEEFDGRVLMVRRHQPVRTTLQKWTARLFGRRGRSEEAEEG